MESSENELVLDGDRAGHFSCMPVTKPPSWEESGSEYPFRWAAYIGPALLKVWYCKESLVKRGTETEGEDIVLMKLQ